MKTQKLLFLIYVFLLHSAAHAQSLRTCRIVFLGAPNNAPETLYLFDGKTSQEVELPSINFSPVYKISATAKTLNLLSAPEADPEKVSENAPTTTLGADVTDFYLFLSSDPANPIAPVKMEIIDATKFTKGQMLWFNRTDNRIEGQIGSEKLSLTGNSQTILNSPASKAEDYAVTISFGRPGEETLHSFCDTKWSHDPQIRNVFFVVANEGSRPPRVMGMRDQRETAKKPKKR